MSDNRDARRPDEKYVEFVSEEPLSVIRANECEYALSSLSTQRFRRVWNEIVDLRAKLAEAEAASWKAEAATSFLALGKMRERLENLGLDPDDPSDTPTLDEVTVFQVGPINDVDLSKRDASKPVKKKTHDR